MIVDVIFCYFLDFIKIKCVNFLFFYFGVILERKYFKIEQKNYYERYEVYIC